MHQENCKRVPTQEKEFQKRERSYEDVSQANTERKGYNSEKGGQGSLGIHVGNKDEHRPTLHDPGIEILHRLSGLGDSPGSVMQDQACDSERSRIPDPEKDCMSSSMTDSDLSKSLTLDPDKDRSRSPRPDSDRNVSRSTLPDPDQNVSRSLSPDKDGNLSSSLITDPRRSLSRGYKVQETEERERYIGLLTISNSPDISNIKEETPKEMYPLVSEMSMSRDVPNAMLMNLILKQGQSQTPHISPTTKSHATSQEMSFSSHQSPLHAAKSLLNMVSQKSMMVSQEGQGQLSPSLISESATMVEHRKSSSTSPEVTQ